ncbi:histidinol-phosphate transaminase [Gudongella oleilytica]|jgi:threonine-phosphate decarboxylase|uniref:pyridoxal phosphate-dependent aminotransferase n=1 Tax=Gudongella oleilytica TaxID=1582259 RepID=UPI002A371D84|nr:histidinol-phosphate transaminase [Gudongella oleilytica]MDY0257386.1 histidinol-phosphate transaminase [Gudongella oleilytica]
MKHGGDILTYFGNERKNIIDFSSNINPIGYPRDLEAQLIKSFEDLRYYPDIKYRVLKNNLSEYLGCNDSNVIAGNGAIEIIDSFIMSFERVVVVIPSFSEYVERASVHNKEIVKISLGTDFMIKPEMFEIVKKGDLVILGNPNNPTGRRLRKEALLELYGSISKKNAFLLLDEAFYEFCPMDYDSIQLFQVFNYKNVGIIRAATKFFGLPGIRLGYCCADVITAKMISETQMPWSINSFAAAASEIIFKDKEFIENSKEYIEKERIYLLNALEQFKILQAYITEANFILIRLFGESEEKIFDFLMEMGILVRKCSSFEGLVGDHIRIAIKSRADNERLIGALMGFEKLLY